MNESQVSEHTDARAAAADLFRRRPPVLVEVRFPGMGTSPDWYLLEDGDDFESLLESLAPNTELHLSSVWDLKEAAGSVRFVRK